MAGVLLTIASAIDASAAGANTPFGPLTVTDAGTYGSGAIFINLSANINAPGCNANNRIDIPASNPLTKQILAMALQALATGATVSGMVNGCDPSSGNATIDTTYNSWFIVYPVN